MIHLVLDDFCAITGDAFLHFLSLDIDPLDIEGSGPLDISDESRQAQTSFFSPFCCLSTVLDDRIDHENDRIGLIILFGGQAGDDDPLVDAYLRSGKTYASMFGVLDIGEHSLSQDSIRMQFMGFDGIGYFSEDGVVLSCLYREFHKEQKLRSAIRKALVL